MKIKSVFTVKLLVFMFCLILSAGTSLFAQNFTQTLRWNADPSIFEYKIVIQDKSGKTIQTLTTEENFIELSLKEGTYKYKITAYDLLGRESVSTDWINFVVAIAKHPEIKHQKTLEALAEDGKTLEMAVDVDDVTVDTLAELVNVATGEKVKGKLVLETAAGAPAAGLSASETHKATKARFTDVPEGQWKLVITNPSGLSSESEQFEVRDVIKEEKLAAQKAEEERLAREQAEREEAERIAREKAAAEEAERQRQEQLAREQAEREEQERLAREQAEREEQERLAREQAEREEAERLAREQAEKEEAERLAKEEAEAKKRAKKMKPTLGLNIMVGAGFVTNVFNSELLNYNNCYNIFNLDNRFMFFPEFAISFVPNNSWIVRPGIELSGYAYVFKHSSGSYMHANGQYDEFESLNVFYNEEVQADLIGQIRVVPNKFFVNVKAGGGINIIELKTKYYRMRDDNFVGFYYWKINGGLSLEWAPVKNLVFELGMDYNKLLTNQVNSSYLKPYLRIGGRL